MRNFIRRFFPKKKAEIAKFSITMTDATEGVGSQKELVPEVEAIVKRLKKSEMIDNNDLNKVASFYFNTDRIQAGIHNVNKPAMESMCFDISGVNVVYNKEGDVENIFLNMREIAFNFDMVITVSVKDFHEVFNHLKFKP